MLKAYVAVLPHSDLAPMLVKWLVQNERGSQWHDTKETAMVVCALTDYIKANNELDPDYDVTVALGDKQARTYHITRDNALLFDNRFLVPDAFLPGGTQTVTLTKTGKGRLYYSSALQYFTTEEHIAGVGTGTEGSAPLLQIDAQDQASGGLGGRHVQRPGLHPDGTGRRREPAKRGHH